jgi:hypothetical protein
MAVDAGIYNQVGQGVKSVQDYDAITDEAAARKQGLQRGSLALLTGQQAYDNAQAVNGQKSALRQLIGSDGFDINNPAHQQRALGVAPDVAPALIKTVQEGAKDQAQTGHYQAQSAQLNQQQKFERADRHLQELGAVQDVPGALSWLKQAQDSGELPPDRVAQAAQQLQQNPQSLGQWKQGALMGGAKILEQLKFQLPDANNTQNNQTSVLNNTATNARSAADAAAARGVTMRGQDMTDARTRESTLATMTKPFEVTLPDGSSALAQQDKQGNIRQVQGYGPKAGSKPLNEGQAKALGYGTRMQESAKILESLDGKYSPSGINAKLGAENSFGGSVTGPIANSLLSDNSQQAEQAQRDFVNAILRRESGAAISSSEFDNARKQYFQQPGDSPAVKMQKKRNRELAINGVLAEVPTALRSSITPPPPSDHPPEIADLLNKYK